MLSPEQLRALMANLESDRVERTTSTKNTDKFGEAICAFANDFPNHRQPVQSYPVAESAWRETNEVDYPAVAIRELLWNAVMHRSYESNAPVRFYWYDDRIEIQNPGGLYGMVSPENFPRQTDYRNPVVSEAMATLGYVNAFGRGVIRARLDVPGPGIAQADVPPQGRRRCAGRPRVRRAGLLRRLPIPRHDHGRPLRRSRRRLRPGALRRLRRGTVPIFAADRLRPFHSAPAGNARPARRRRCTSASVVTPASAFSIASARKCLWLREARLLRTSRSVAPSSRRW